MKPTKNLVLLSRNQCCQMVLTTLRFHIHISEVLEILPFEQQKKDPFQQKPSNFLAGHCSEMVPTPPKRCFKDVSLFLGAFFSGAFLYHEISQERTSSGVFEIFEETDLAVGR